MKILLLFLMGSTAVAFPGNWKSWEARDCFEREVFDYPDKTNSALLELACNVISIGRGYLEEDWTFSLHSGGRPLSQHKVFNALDFHLSDYSKSQNRLSDFKSDMEILEFIFRTIGVDNVIGFGIYPNQNNPFFHIDLRGHRARWARVVPSGSAYVGYEAGKKWIDENL